MEKVMRFYWGVNSIPELKGLPKEQQRQLWKSCWRASLRRPRIWGSYVFLALLIAVAPPLTRLVYILGESLERALVAGLVAGLAGWLINDLIIIPAIRPLIAARRAAMEPRARHADGSYYVPPEF